LRRRNVKNEEKNDENKFLLDKEDIGGEGDEMCDGEDCETDNLLVDNGDNEEGREEEEEEEEEDKIEGEEEEDT